MRVRSLVTLAVVCVALALSAGTAHSQSAFSPPDLAGVWQLSVLTGSGAAGAAGSTARGVVQIDAAGAVTGGSLLHSDGSTTTLSGGQLSITADGLVAGTLTTGNASTLQTATITEARMLVDRRVVVGVVAGGDLGVVSGDDFGLLTLVRVFDGGTTDDLQQTWRYHELRTPGTPGQPPVSVVGDVAFSPAGTLSGGTLALSSGVTASPGGTLAESATGSVGGTITGVGADWTLTGQIAESRDLVIGTTAVGATAFGLAVTSLVPDDAAFTVADLAGAWSAYAVLLDGAQGNLGQFLRGALVLDGTGAVVSGTLRDPAGPPAAVTGNTLAVEASGRTTGTLVAGTRTFTLDGTLRGAGDLLSGVAAVDAPGGPSLGLLVLARAVSVVRFDAAAYTVAEGATAQITVLREGETSGTTDVTLTAQGPRFGNRSFAVTFGPGVTSRTVAITTVEDTDAGAETVTLALTDLPLDAVSGPTAVLTITDNETAGVIKLGAATFNVVEGATLTIPVQRTGTKLGGGVTVGWEVTGGTATAGADYTLAAGGTLTFGPGSTTQPLLIPTIGDAIAEGPETIALRLVNPTRGATLGTPNTTTVTIQDNDVAGSVQFAVAAVRVSETAGAANVSVTRTGGAAAAVTVDYATSDGTARAGVDYTAVSGTLTFGAGQTLQTFQVPLIDTALAEGDRTVRLTLANPGGRATLGSLKESTLTILDDEVGLRFDAPAYSVAENGGGATITVVRTGPPVGVASVTFSTSDGTAGANADYVPTSGRLVFQPTDKSKTFRVTVLEDTLVESAETVLLALSNPAGALLGAANTSILTIVDNDKGGIVQMGAAAISISEALPSAAIVVKRTGGAASAVTVDYATSDGTAQAGQDYGETTGTLTFGTNETSRTILVPLLDDRIVEGPETFVVTLSNPGGGATLGTPAQTTVTLVDDDAGGVLKFSAAAYRVDEPTDSPTVFATITVLRTGTNLAGSVSVQYASSDGTAVAGTTGDYAAAAGELVFGPGETEKSLQVTIRGDAFQEADETVVLTLSDPQGGATLGTPASAVLTIVDPTPSVQFEQAEYLVEERAGSAVLTVVRSGPNAGTLLVGFATSDLPDGDLPPGHALAGSDYRTTSGTLTFKPGESRKTISVPILVDPAAEDTESFRVSLSVPGSVALGLNHPGLVTILDSARPGSLQFAVEASSVREGTPAVVTVTRTGGLDGVATVAWSATGGTATPVADFSPASGALTFPAGTASKTFTLTIVNDTIAEPDETVMLQLGAVTGPVSLGATVTHTLTIQDNDVAGTLELSADAYTVAEGAGVVITVRRTGGAAGGVTVQYATQDLPAGPGAATAGADYTAVSGTLTFAVNQTTKTFTVPTTLDSEVEPDEAFSIVLSDPGPAGLATLGARTMAAVTIVDRQPRLALRDAFTRVVEGQTATVFVTRTGSSLGQVTVGFRTVAGTGAESVDYMPVTGVLTFGTGQTSKSFTVTTLANATVDGTRTVALQLFDPTSASLGLAEAELRIDDNEKPGTVQFSQAAYAGGEGATAQLVVTRTGGVDGTAIVQYDVVDGTATSGVDYTLAPGSLTLAPGVTSATIPVPTVADGLPEGTETVVVQLTGVTGGAALGAITTTTLFVVDAEQTVAFGAAAFEVGETATQAPISIVRGGLPTGTLVVTARTDETGTAVPGLDYTPVTTSLTFAPGDVIKTVPVPILPSAVARTGNRTVGLLLEGDPGVVGMPGAATLTILDFRPDLVVAAVAPPSSALSGKLLSAPMSVRNSGLVTSPPFQVGVFIAKNDGTPGSQLPGAGTLLSLESIPALAPNQSMSLTTTLALADDLPGGDYFVSAIADFSNAVGEVDEGNNGRASAPSVIRITRNLGKLTSAAATFTQTDAAPLVVGAAADTFGTCDAVGSISLTGSFQITQQIGPVASAVARLTGTFNDQPVTYNLSLNLTIADDNAVTASFSIDSITGAFSGNGLATFSGMLNDRTLLGSVTGTVNTAAGVCSFSGTLQASGEVSFVLALEERAQGGTFTMDATPQLALPVAVSEYLAEFQVFFDDNFPMPATVTFTGPAGSGLTGAPASGRRSLLDPAAAAAVYSTAPVRRTAGGPGGDYTVVYKGAPRVIGVPEPVTATRLVLAIPTVEVDAGGLLTRVTWTWADRTGAPMDPPAFVGLVQVLLESNAGTTPLYVSPTLPRGNTSHVLTAPVLWEDAAELAMLYVDTVTGHAYRVAYPRTVRAFAELATEHTVDNQGIADGRALTLTFVAPTGLVDTATASVQVTGAGLTNEPVPFFGRTPDGVDHFRLRVDVADPPPAAGTPVIFTMTPIAGAPRQLLTSLRNQATNQSIQFVDPVGTSEADAMLGVRRQVAWTLPPPAAQGGFDVDSVTLTGIVRAPDGVGVCLADADRELGPDATLGFVTLPATCNGQAVDSAQICVAVLGTGGELARTCHTFGPDPMVVEFAGGGRGVLVTEGATAKIQVNRSGPSRRPATVDFATRDVDAVQGIDYVAAQGTLTFPPGQNQATFDVTTLNDALDRGAARSLDLTLSNPGAGVTVGTAGTLSLQIAGNDEGGGVAFAATALKVLEGGAVSVVVNRAALSGKSLAGNVSVGYVVTGGTAVGGIDYTPVGGTLTFGAGQASTSFTVQTLANTLADGTRTLVLKLVNPLGGAQVTSAGQTTLSIVDDEAGGVIQFTQTTFTVTEGVTTLNLPLARAGTNLGGNVSVDFRVGAASTATAALDFTLAAGTLTFAAGQTTHTLPVQILDDALADRDKVLVVELLNPRGGSAALGAGVRATITLKDNEQEVQFDKSAYEIGEGGLVRLVVTRTGPLTGTATVSYATAGSSAASGGDFAAKSGTLTFGPKVTRIEVPVQTLQDATGEFDEVFFVTLSSPSPGVVLGPRSTATVTILDDEQTVRFAATSTVAAEGGTATIVVERRGEVSTTTAVDYATSNGTATAPGDYTARSGTLTFPPRVTSLSFTVPTKNNTLDDGTRTVGLTLSNARTIALPSVPVLITRSSSTLFITDEETGGVIQFGAATASFSEKQPTILGIVVPVSLTVTRTGTNLASGVTVSYAVTGGTAPTADYSLPAGTLTFGAGQASAGILLRINDNAAADHNRTVVVQLSGAAGGGTLGATTSTTVTIVDDEQELQFSSTGYSIVEGGAATITVTRGGPTTGTATVAYATGGGTATPLLDYTPASGVLTFGPGVTSRTISVPTFKNTIDDTLAQTVGLLLGSPSAGALLGPRSTATLTIADDDQGGAIQFSSSAFSAVEGSPAGLTVTRTGTNLASGVTVGYQVVAGGTAVNGTDFTLASGTLTFIAGEASKTLTVPTIDTTIVDGTRTVFVRLVSPTGGATLGTTFQTTLSILDNDQGGTIQFTTSAVAFSENQPLIGIPPFQFRRLATLGVSRTGTNLASGVTVSYRVAGGSAVNGTDYNLSNGTLSFGANQSSAVIGVSLIDDTVAEGDRTVVVEVLSPTGGATLGTTRFSTLTIQDDEQSVQFKLSGYSVGEGGTAAITVLRSGPTTSQITVQYATISGGTATAGSDYVTTSGTLTFPPGTTSATFQVATLQDALFEGNETVRLQLSSPSAGVLLGTRTQATLTIADDEQRVRFPVSSVNATAGSTLSLPVVREGPPTGTVTVNYETFNGSATAPSDYKAVKGTLTFGPGVTSQSIFVPTAPNGIFEPSESFGVRILNAGPGLLLGSPNQVTVTIP